MVDFAMAKIRAADSVGKATKFWTYSMIRVRKSELGVVLFFSFVVVYLTK
jgi:hypothetical protein